MGMLLVDVLLQVVQGGELCLFQQSTTSSELVTIKLVHNTYIIQATISTAIDFSDVWDKVSH